MLPLSSAACNITPIMCINVLSKGYVYGRFSCLETGPSLTLYCNRNSHLSVHIVNRLLRENQKTIPKYLSGKKLLKNVTLQILNFIPVS